MSLTKSVGGKELGPEQFAYVGDPQDPSTWHLPMEDQGHVQAAMGRFDQADMPDAAKKKAAFHKLMAAAKKMSMDTAGFEKAHSAMMAGALDGQWMEIFRAGDYGDKGAYTPADLDRMVANYDPARHEAPVVLGHPELDSPAYGWVESVKRSGDVLLGKLRQVDPGFEELVRSGRFKKRSVAIYRTEAGPALRHLGFLGAVPPEVKGLADLTLCEFDDRVFQAIDFNEEEDDDVDIKEMQKSFLETLKEFFGGKRPEAAAFSSEEVDKRVKEATKAFEAKVAELTTQFNEQKTAAEKAATAAASAASSQLASDAVKDLKAKQRWVPAFDKMGVPEIFAELAKSPAKVSFGEGDKKKEKTLLQVFADFLAGLPEIVPVGEIAGAAASAKKGGARFNEATGIVLDMASVALRDAAKKRAQESKISFGEALAQLRSEGFKPEGAAAAGEV